MIGSSLKHWYQIHWAYHKQFGTWSKKNADKDDTDNRQRQQHYKTNYNRLDKTIKQYNRQTLGES